MRMILTSLDFIYIIHTGLQSGDGIQEDLVNRL